MFKYIKNSFVYFSMSNNIPYYNNFNRIVYSILSIISSVVTLITFGFIIPAWPTDYMCYLIKQRCKERKQK